MRLWQKISAACVLVLLLVVFICGFLMLRYTRNSLLDSALEQAQSEQLVLQDSFISMASYYLKDTDSLPAKKAVIKYCFERFAGTGAVLIQNDKTIISDLSIDPRKYLKTDRLQSIWQGEIYGRSIIIAAGSDNIRSDLFEIYTVTDITPVYDQLYAMARRFALIGFAGTVLGAILIIAMVRYASKPLIYLRSKTRKIAGGEYSERSLAATNDEIGELASDFNVMAEAVEAHVAKLKDTAERQRMLLSGLTHEFKTPLTSLILYSETLLTTDLTEEDEQTALVHINTQCKWLESLTQKMLQLTSLHADICLTAQTPDELFEDVKQSMEPVLKDRGIQLCVEHTEDVFSMDYDLMKSVLINLTDNASKASAAGQTVFLRAYKGVIEVEDSGCGIPDEEIDKVTEAFYMADKARSKAKGGSGLGLAIVKRIVDAHGAEMEIRSHIGKGTTVKIIFPCNKNITF